MKSLLVNRWYQPKMEMGGFVCVIWVWLHNSPYLQHEHNGSTIYVKAVCTFVGSKLGIVVWTNDFLIPNLSS